MRDFLHDVIEQVNHIKSLSNAFGATSAMEDLSSMLTENYAQLLNSFGESQTNQAMLIRDGLQANAALNARIDELEAEFVKFRKSSNIIISIMTDRNLELETLLSKAQEVLFTKIARIKELEAELNRLREQKLAGVITWEDSFFTDADVREDRNYNFYSKPKLVQELRSELIEWVRIQRNDIPATGEEFSNAIELWFEDRMKGGV